MNRSLLLAPALVLMAVAASPMARAQSPKKPAPVSASLDCLKAVRVHTAMMRAQPLALPPAVVRVPKAVPPKPWAGEPSVITAVMSK